MYGDNKDIDAVIHIKKGEVKVELMRGSNGPITSELDQLLIIRDVVADHVRHFERNYQKKFIPNSETKYILPKDQI